MDEFICTSKVDVIRDGKDRLWFAIYTAPNHEKKVERHLDLKGVEVFLPLITVSRKWKNRTTAKVDLPLFAGYLFARISSSERGRVLEAPGVLSIVGNSREPIPLPDVEIQTLRTAIQYRLVDPFPYLKIGARARIRTGPLAGLEGIVHRKDGRLRVVLSVDLIQRSFAVYVDADELEPCKEPNLEGFRTVPPSTRSMRTEIGPPLTPRNPRFLPQAD